MCDILLFQDNSGLVIFGMPWNLKTKKVHCVVHHVLDIASFQKVSYYWMREKLVQVESITAQLVTQSDNLQYKLDILISVFLICR